MTTRPRRIYIAEDVVGHGELLRAHLEADAGLEITVFTDGLAAYRAVQKSAPDLLLLDIILPSLTGLAMARLLKFVERYRNLPLIMSSITDPDIERRALECGADRFLPKPLDMNRLVSTVHQLLGGEQT